VASELATSGGAITPGCSSVQGWTDLAIKPLDALMSSSVTMFAPLILQVDKLERPTEALEE
jgi:hypothetical protein